MAQHLKTGTWQGTAILLLTLAASNALAQSDDLLSQAQRLIQAGKSQAAFQLLQSHEAEQGGQPQFDLLLGIAAAESGQNTRAVFALERVLAAEPENTRARAEIARAYLALGETDTARAEFNTVRTQEIPDEVARTIDRYLDAVDRIDQATRTTIRGYLEATFGHDTNVNVGPNRSTVAIPGFGNLPFSLSANSRANSDNFTTISGGLTLRHPLTREWAITAGLSGWNKMNADKSHFDTASLDGNVGIAYSVDRNAYTLTAQRNQFWVDDEGFRNATGLTLQWQHNYNARNQFSAFLQYSKLEYDEQKIRDADRWVVGGAYAHALQGGEVLFASLYRADEKEKAADVPFLGYEAYGIRLGAQTSANKPLVFFGSGSLEQRRYGGFDLAFQTTRKDLQLDLNLGATYRFSREWSVTPRFSYTKNDSNTELNEYDRKIYSVSLRRDF